MEDDLTARLKGYSRAFEGIMSLIPAKEYYGKDASITSEQWRKTKKQTREERQNAKRAKLDPASHKTAKDVMDENARKRKRELEGEGEECDVSSEPDFDVEKEKPREGLKRPAANPKKQKTTDQAKPKDTAEDAIEDVADAPTNDAEQVQANAKIEKMRRKAEKKREKAALKKQKIEEKKAQKQEAVAAFGKDDHDNENTDGESEGEDTQVVEEPEEDRIQPLDISGLIDEQQSTPPTADSAASTSSKVSAESSSSSLPPPTIELTKAQVEKTPKNKFDLTPEAKEQFKARLAAKLEQLRAARKADGPDGRPARNRAELIEARRKKQQERKAAKKANRVVAKEDEARMKAEAELARLRGSGSPYSISGMLAQRSSPDHEQNLAFGKVAWRDGKQLDTRLSGFIDSSKRKGPSDVKTALEAAKKKHARINGLDEEKRKDIQEKDLWLNAKKRAQGEKVHDDLSLLKKSAKRKEKLKAKSKQEWKERITSIEKGKEIRQKKRETNLQKRKEESKKGGAKGKGKKPAAKKVKRAGFEGTFRGR